jgi:hypothetical protein
MNCIYICYVEESRQPLWYSGQSSWLQIEMYCVSCEVIKYFVNCCEKEGIIIYSSIYICYVEESGPPLWSSG